MQTCSFCSVYLSTAYSPQHQLVTKFVCQQCHLTQDAIPEVFLSMVKLVFDNVINVTADVLLSGRLCSDGQTATSRNLVQELFTRQIYQLIYAFYKPMLPACVLESHIKFLCKQLKTLVNG
ncbi:hypothetical protein BgiMline_011701 [Biomphalaria glabrata]|nr:hypothetical protein BgiMline_029176 [Biomphalaria glabrata]